MPIFDLQLEAAWRPRACVTRRWWEQGGIYIQGIREEGGGRPVEAEDLDDEESYR